MTKTLWTAQEVEKATGGVLQGAQKWQVSNVVIDSRQVKTGDLFVALKGPNHDGHDYLQQVLDQGAVAAIVERAVPVSIPQVVVNNSYMALEALARAARERASKVTIVAVTGSVGKTGAKEALTQIFKDQGKTHATVGNLNNHIGVPLTLARMPQDSDFAVIEIGMNHAGEISPLSKMVQPDVALITTVEAVHLEFFDSVAEIAKAKSEIFDGLKPGGTAVMLADNPYWPQVKVAAKKAGAKQILGFGKSRAAKSKLMRVIPGPMVTVIEANILGDQLTFKMRMQGQHWAVAATGILAAAKAAGADLALAGLAIAEVKPSKGRGERIEVRLGNRNFVVVDDSYNASPVSVTAAIRTLSEFPVVRGGRRVVALGDMLELGPKGPELHESLAPIIAEAGVDLVFTAGTLMKNLYEQVPSNKRGGHYANSSRLSDDITRFVRPTDVVLVKGSAGSKMSLVVEALKALHGREYERSKRIGAGGAGDVL